jgi:hypothetical protein
MENETELAGKLLTLLESLLVQNLAYQVTVNTFGESKAEALKFYGQTWQNPLSFADRRAEFAAIRAELPESRPLTVAVEESLKLWESTKNAKFEA